MKSRFTINRILPLVCIAFLLSFGTFAQQKKKISLQGLLKDGSGKAVKDDIYSATFKLYTTLSGGDAVWTENQDIAVKGGIYSALLGSSVSLDSDKLNWGTNSYFVGVSIKGVELSPRTELTFAPYSLGSPSADVATTVKCSGAVGDVKYSILNPTQFKDVNGDCWVPMDGRNIFGTKLATILGTNTIPDAGGLFLRGQEFANSPDNDPGRTSASTIAVLQDESFKSHNHNGNTSDAGTHTHPYLDLVRTYSDFNVVSNAGGANVRPVDVNPKEFSRNTSEAGLHKHTISSDGGQETRPKNLNLWTYIRIN